MLDLKLRDGCTYDIVGLGQNSVDHLFVVDELPAEGSKTDARSHELLPGGQVATAVLAAHRLGRRVCYVGAVGDDELAACATSVLRAEGVETRIKQAPAGRTQLAAVMVDGRGERTIVEHHDPSTVVRAGDLDPRLMRDARILHLDISDVPAALRAARWAREAGALVSLDIDHLRPGAEELLPLVDLLVASEGLGPQLDCPDPRRALVTLGRHNPDGLACITMGERGCLALPGRSREVLFVPAFAVDVVDTTGCGDVFRGALMHAVLARMTLEQGLRFAAAAAALQARTLGAQGGVPDLADVQAYLERDPPPASGPTARDAGRPEHR